MSTHAMKLFLAAADARCAVMKEIVETHRRCSQCVSGFKYSTMSLSRLNYVEAAYEGARDELLYAISRAEAEKVTA